MFNILLFVFLAAFFLLIIICNTKTIENYGEGALTQLYTKGPQDTYLTVNTEKYIPEYWWGYYPFHYYKWNVPTRYGGYYYPLYGIYPNNNYTYPFNYL
jgi:hypothetical protein